MSKFVAHVKTLKVGDPLDDSTFCGAVNSEVHYNFGQAKQGPKFVVPTFHIHFLNPECVRIPWVLAPKNFPIENFRVRSDLGKKFRFSLISLAASKKKVSGSCTHNFDATDLPNS